MKLIGVTGGVGCGKSFVMEQLSERYHAKIILADLIAHELMEPGQKSYQEIINHFGKKILKEDGAIDRQVLGAIVFQDPEELKRLNQMTHPNVKDEILHLISTYEQLGKQTKEVSFIALEAALLLEEQYDTICDEVWFVDARDEVRIERLMEKRGYSREKCLDIMGKQLKREEFIKRCQRVIQNDTTKEAVIEQLDQIVAEL